MSKSQRLRPSTRRLGRRLSAHSRATLSRLRRLSRLRVIIGTTRRADPTGTPQRRRRQLTWVATPLILIALILVFIGRVVPPKIDIAANVRQSVLPQLRQELGLNIEVGRIDSDYLSRVVLHDVVIGRNPHLPLGALARAKTVTLAVDLIGLLQHRNDPLAALSSVTLDQPQFTLTRDKTGKLNWEKVLARRKHGVATRWRGLITVHNGRVWYADATQRDARGRQLIADGRAIEASVRLNGDQPATARAEVGHTFVGGTTLKTITVGGDFDLAKPATPAWVALDVALPPVPAPLLTRFAFPKSEVDATRGSVDGHITIAYDTAARAPDRLRLAAAINLREVTVAARNLKLPHSSAPLVFSRLNGPISFTDYTLTSSGLTADALSSPLRLSGVIALPVGTPKTAQQLAPAALVNVVISSTALATAPLARLLPLPTRLQSGAARLTLRLTGGANRLGAAGTLLLPVLQAHDPRWGSVHTSLLETTFNFAAGDAGRREQHSQKTTAATPIADLGHLLDNGRLSATFTLHAFDAGTADAAFHRVISGGGDDATGTFNLNYSRGRLLGAEVRFKGRQLAGSSGGFGGVPALRVTGGAAQGVVRLRRAATTAPPSFDADLSLINWALRRGSAGTSAPAVALRGRNLHLVAATTSAAPFLWQGIAGADGIDANSFDPRLLGAQVAAQYKQLGVSELGTLAASVRFTAVAAPGAALQNARADAAFTLSGATVQGTRLRAITGRAQFGGGHFTLAQARAESAFGPFTLDLSAPGGIGSGGNIGDLRLSAPRLALNADRLNPLLADLGWRAAGPAVGRLDIHSVGDNSYRAGFDFNLPEATLAAAGRSKRAGSTLLALQGARVRGNAIVRRGAGGRWMWQGSTQLAATRAGISRNWREAQGAAPAAAIPVWFDGAKVEGLQLMAAGNIGLAGGKAAPHLSGSIAFSRAALGLKSQREPGQMVHTTLVGGEVQAQFNLDDKGLALPRFSTRLTSLDSGAGSNSGTPKATGSAAAQLGGHLAVMPGGAIAGQLLAQNIDAAAALKTMGPLLGVPGQLALNGRTFARVDVSGNSSAPQAAAQLRLYRGTAAYAGHLVPIDAARLAATFGTSGRNAVTIDDLTLWSHGARVRLSGTVLPRAQGSANPADYALDLDAELNDVRLADIGVMLGDITPGPETDGLVGATWHIDGTLGRPRIAGATSLRLAQVLGVAVDTASAQLYYERTSGGPRLGLARFEARVDDADLSGQLRADAPRNSWSAQLKVSDASTDRLLRSASRVARDLGMRAGAARIRAWQNAPLRSNVHAEIDVAGDFSALHNGPVTTDLLLPTPRVKSGTITAGADDLRWRGRDLGMLSLAAQVQEDGIEIQDLTLLRQPEQTGGNQPSSLQISGLFPYSADATLLDATLKVSNEHLSFLQLMLRQLEGTLRAQGELVPSLNAIVNGITALPDNLEGDLEVDARATGSWRRPILSVQTAVSKAQLGTQLLPTLDTSLVFEDGGVTIRNLDVKMTAPAVAGPNEEERETVLRVAEGGRVAGGDVSLNIELLNANLSQLAQWLPALRAADGKPLLRGKVALFSIQVRGKLTDPLVTGSIIAQDLVYRNYTLDDVSVSVFNIAGGHLSIEPGFLQIVKGSFTTQVWGKLPWDWSRFGLVMDAPIEVHLPLTTKNFGALAGVLVPAVAEAAADSFTGTIDVTGTVEAPQFTGEAEIRNGRLRANPAAIGADFGVADLSGAVRFGEGNIITVDNLHGRLITATAVDARTTNNLPAAERDPRAARRAIVNPTQKPPELGGDFALSGKVALDMDPRNFEDPTRAITAHRYDLKLTLKNGIFRSNDISGLREVDLAAQWKTGEGDAHLAQNVSVTFSAAGSRNAGKARSAVGKVNAQARVRLAPNFANSLNAFFRSNFDGSIAFKSFGFSARNLATGTLDGTLSLSDGTITRNQTVPRIRTALAALEDPALAQAPAPGGGSATDAAPGADPRREGGARTALKIAGALTLSDTDIMGAPGAGAGGSGELPYAPIFDIDILIGKQVQFMTSTLRAGFNGSFKVQGTPHDPDVEGRVTINGGQIRFPAATTRITEGAITLKISRDQTGEIRSIANIEQATARGQAGRYAITIDMHGEVDFSSAEPKTFTLNVTSIPALSSAEAFSKLTGTSPGDNGGDSSIDSKTGQAYASTFLSLISLPVFAGIERSLQESLGVDFVFDYRLSEPVSLTVGKAIGDRVYITYRRTVGNSHAGDTTAYELRVDYRIKGDYQLGFQTDDRGVRQFTLNKTFRF